MITFSYPTVFLQNLKQKSENIIFLTDNAQRIFNYQKAVWKEFPDQFNPFAFRRLYSIAFNFWFEESV